MRILKIFTYVSTGSFTNYFTLNITLDKDKTFYLVWVVKNDINLHKNRRKNFPGM